MEFIEDKNIQGDTMNLSSEHVDNRSLKRVGASWCQQFNALLFLRLLQFRATFPWPILAFTFYFIIIGIINSLFLNGSLLLVEITTIVCSVASGLFMNRYLFEKQTMIKDLLRANRLKVSAYHASNFVMDYGLFMIFAGCNVLLLCFGAFPISKSRLIYS